VADTTKMREAGGTSVTKRDVFLGLGANLLHMVWRESTTRRELAGTWAVIHREERDKALDGHCHMADTRAGQHRATKLEEVADTEAAVAVATEVAVAAATVKADKEAAMHLLMDVKLINHNQH